MSRVKEAVIEAFETNIGLDLNDYKNIALKDLQIDSFEFINFIVDIEEKLSIELPEEYLLINELPDLETFSQVIENLFKFQHKTEV